MFWRHESLTIDLLQNDLWREKKGEMITNNQHFESSLYFEDPLHFRYGNRNTSLLPLLSRIYRNGVVELPFRSHLLISIIIWIYKKVAFGRVFWIIDYIELWLHWSHSLYLRLLLHYGLTKRMMYTLIKQSLEDVKKKLIRIKRRIDLQFDNILLRLSAMEIWHISMSWLKEEYTLIPTLQINSNRILNMYCEKDKEQINYGLHSFITLTSSPSSENSLLSFSDMITQQNKK